MSLTARRLASIDLLRVVGIIAIVAGHVWDGELIRLGLYTWHVPVFFFLTGYFWTRSRPSAVEAAKRARSLLIPYVVWLLAIGAAFAATTGGGSALVRNILLGGSYIGKPFSAFWFVTALFAACLLLRALQRFPMWVPALVAAGGLGAAYVVPHRVESVPWSIGVAVPAMVFILAGYGFRRLEPGLPAPRLAGFGLVAVAVALIASGVSAPVDMKGADFGTPGVSVATAVLLSAGLVLIAKAVPLPAPVASAATRLATVGLCVILMHSAVLWVCDLAGVTGWAAFTAAVAIPWAFACLVHSTTFSVPFTGAERRAHRSHRRAAEPVRAQRAPRPLVTLSARTPARNRSARRR